MERHIYADNAATTRLDPDALEAMLPWLKDGYGNASQPYSFARAPKKALAEARAAIAECINARPEEICFTSGGTESDNWAVKAAALSDLSCKIAGADGGNRADAGNGAGGGKAPGGGIIASAIEHHAVLNSCAALAHRGYPVKYLRPTPCSATDAGHGCGGGKILPQELERLTDDGTRLVSVMTVNNELGTVQPIAELCRIAHAHGALFHTDAVQAVGHMKIDVRETGVDLLSASAHKFNGPKGVGFLYIRGGVVLPSYEDGGAQESGRRAGTENVASIAAMAAALTANCRNLEENRRRISEAEARLLGRLDASGADYVRCGGDTLPGIVSLSFPGKDGEAILHRLDLMGISVSTGAACDSRKVEISHVLRAIGLDETLARGTIRISLGRYNTAEEADEIAAALYRITSESF